MRVWVKRVVVERGDDGEGAADAREGGRFGGAAAGPYSRLDTGICLPEVRLFSKEGVEGAVFFRDHEHH